jgi:hypothetical protein
VSTTQAASTLEKEDDYEQYICFILAGAKSRRLVAAVMRAENAFDNAGNPIYNVNMAPVMAVASVPPELKQTRN